MLATSQISYIFPKFADVLDVTCRLFFPALWLFLGVGSDFIITKKRKKSVDLQAHRHADLWST